MRTRKMMLYAGMIASLTMGIFISGAGQQKVEAKTKVTYTLKKGTLTIKGKGAMPAKMKFRRNKKIKKVIIKKGVTSVSYEAFALCKNLNSVTIPSTVKTIGIRSFYGTKISKITVPSKTKTIGQGAFGSCKDLKTIVMPGDFKLKLEEDTDDKLWYVASDQSAVDTITFNTKLKLANVSYLSANNLVVAKNDPSYQSIEGVIYTKDGKGIVRVPQKRTELKIKEGCTEFNMQSVLYNSTDSEGDEFNNCSKLKKIVIVACGSAYHVGVVAKYAIEKTVRIPVEIDIASEFRYRDPIIDENVLVLVISQSGETADTLAALREAKKLGARVLSIVNVVGSSIANESDDVLYTWAGPEISVATTKAYSTQLCVVYLLVLYMADLLGTISKQEYQNYVADLEALPSLIEKTISDTKQIQAVAAKYYQCENIFFIGRNIDYALSLEGSLKLKEISYIHSEAYAAGELKHGSISLIEDGTLVVSLATYEALFDKMMSNIKEVKARGATVLSLTTEDKTIIESETDEVFYIPNINSMMAPSLAVLPLQLFAYYVADNRGCDIDKPRNLAKSVTVE